MAGNSNSGRRPYLVLDERRVSDLAFLGHSTRAIAAAIGCDKMTINRRFWALIEERRADRLTTLTAALAATSLSTQQ
jgi:hypothetical protein